MERPSSTRALPRPALMLAALYVIVVATGFAAVVHAGRDRSAEYRDRAHEALRVSSERVGARLRARAAQAVDIANRVPADPARWTKWLSEVQAQYDIAGVALLSSDGQVAAASGQAIELTPALRERARSSSESRGPLLNRLEPRRGARAAPAYWLDQLVPRASAVLWMRSHVDTELGALIDDGIETATCGERSLWRRDDAGFDAAITAGRGTPANATPAAALTGPRDASLAGESKSRAELADARPLTMPIPGTDWWVQAGAADAACGALAPVGPRVKEALGWTAASLLLLSGMAYRLWRHAVPLDVDKPPHDAEEALDRLSWLASSSPEALFILDESLRVVATSPTAAASYRNSHGSLTGQNIQTLMSSQPGADALIRALAQSREVRHVDHRTPNGGFSSIAWSVYTIDVDRRPYFALVVRDVSAERRAEQDLRASEARFRALAETLPVGIFRSDLKGRRIYANARMIELTGWPRLPYGAPPRRELFHPLDRERAAAEFDAAYAERRGARVELRLIWPDGSVRSVVVQIEPERDEHGEVTGFVGSMTDVTSMRQVREAAETRAQLLQAVFDTPFVCTIVVDADSGRIQMVNQAMCTLLGYTKEELQARRWADLLDAEQRERALIPLREMLRGENDGYRAHRTYIRSDGGHVEVDIDIRCMRRADGWVDKIIAVAQPDS